MLKEAAHGEVFAAGHAESGNDVPVLASTTRAEKVEGGYRFTGHKSFGSLGPAWTRMGLHGIDTSDPEHPKVVHAFVRRETPGLSIKPTWDGVLGMRATRSDDTILEGAFVPDRDIARVVPAGFAGADAFVLGIFAWALTGFASVYYGLARRAFDMTVERVKSKKSVALARPSMAYHPGYQQAIAECVLDLEAMGPHLDRVAHDWSTGVDHGPLWPVKIVAMKSHVVEAAFRVVDRCLDVQGGHGIFPAAGMERMFRDARLGPHPPRERLPRPRDLRQGHARHRSRRSAALGARRAIRYGLLAPGVPARRHWHSVAQLDMAQVASACACLSPAARAVEQDDVRQVVSLISPHAVSFSQAVSSVQQLVPRQPMQAVCVAALVLGSGATIQQMPPPPWSCRAREARARSAPEEHFLMHPGDPPVPTPLTHTPPGPQSWFTLQSELHAPGTATMPLKSAHCPLAH